MLYTTSNIQKWCLHVFYFLVWSINFFRNDSAQYVYLGDHGYDNNLPSMRAMFGAIGPSIKERNIISEFQNIELYNLFSGKFVKPSFVVSYKHMKKIIKLQFFKYILIVKKFNNSI